MEIIRNVVIGRPVSGREQPSASRINPDLRESAAAEDQVDDP